MSAARRLCILCNPTAGGGRAAKALEAVERTLAGRGLDFHVARSESSEHAAQLAHGAAERGDEVVAFGGDGMVRIVAHAVRGTDAVLGILPGGRGNDFGRALGIPRDPLAACDVLAAGRTRPVDAGDVNGETFLGVASFGFDSDANKLANQAPRFLGRGVYAYAALRALARWRPAQFELTLDGTPHRFTGYTAAAANSGRYGGGMRLAPDARLDDGLLDIVVIGDAPKRSFLRNVPKVFAGSHIELDSVTVLRGREARLAADRRFDVYADGDVVASTPALVRAIPEALNVCAPPPSR